MKQISVQENKQISIGILEAIDSFCRSHDIDYSIGYGTLIGAVRHKGFIPWDDDIDIIMTRNNYEIFRKCFNDTSPSEFIRLCDSSSIPNYPYPFVKVDDTRTVKEEAGYNKMGVSIDVFPFDMIPNSGLRRRIHCFEGRVLWHLFNLKKMSWRHGRGFLKNLSIILLKIPAFCFPYDYLLRMTERLSTKYDRLHTSDLGCVVGAYGKKDIMPASFMQDYIDILFEGKQFRCISEYDKWLRSLYGDYMQLPPKDQRQPKHIFRAYWV